MAKEYDAVHLTVAGELATRDSTPAKLEGWEMESIYWMRWVFDNVEPLDVAMPDRRPTPPPQAP
jgi:hypothetical protein